MLWRWFLQKKHKGLGPLSKTPRSYNFGRKLDGEVATDRDWEQWEEEFWEKEAKIVLDKGNHRTIFDNLD